MRQATNTKADNRLRTALENMRFGACTEKDIEFLESRVAGFRPENPKLNAPNIRNTSIITARNSQKDALNQLGAERFATETRQKLTHFFSIDRISARSVDKVKWKDCEQSGIKKMTKNVQQKLANDATDLCITKGQEAVVVGWDSALGPLRQEVLETLFVQLVNPPRPIQIEGLPLNVVPLPRTVTQTTVLLPDDTLLSILREQTQVAAIILRMEVRPQGPSSFSSSHALEPLNGPTYTRGGNLR
ncbi:hypothetical protein C8R44DRAFT_834710 [Mycena epipterygia]|nr:hypothetical protein C8R44DRAFT_834710 [Mycena epipterygia]